MVSQDPTDFGEGDGRMSRSLALVAWLGTPTGRRVWIALMVAFTGLRSPRPPIWPGLCSAPSPLCMHGTSRLYRAPTPPNAVLHILELVEPVRVTLPSAASGKNGRLGAEKCGQQPVRGPRGAGGYLCFLAGRLTGDRQTVPGMLTCWKGIPPRVTARLK